MRMPAIKTSVHSPRRRAIFAIALSVVTVLLFSANAATPRSPSQATSGLLITPSTVVLLVGDESSLSAVDETGRPVSNVHWSINPPIADLQEENGEIVLEGKEAGRAVLSATANNQSATAVVSVVSGDKLPAGTVRWSVQPMPGFQTLLVMPAVPTDRGPAFYSIEWSKTATATASGSRVI